MMPNRHRFSALLVALLLSSGCADNTPGDPTLRQANGQDGLRLEIALARDTVAVGDTNIVTMRLVNQNNEAVKREFHLRAVDNTTGQHGYVLAPGAYRVYAVLQAPINKTQLRSSTLGFVIR